MNKLIFILLLLFSLPAFGAGSAPRTDAAEARIAAAEVALMPNLLINGGCSFEQRGPKTSVSGSLVYGGPDRWVSAASGITTWYAFSNQTASSIPGSKTPQVCYIDVTPTTSSSIGVEQRIEATNSRSLNGKTITLSFWYYNDAATGTTQVEALLFKPTALDNWTAQTQVAANTVSTITNGVAWQKIVWTYTLGSSDATNGLAVRLRFQNTTNTSRQVIRFGEVMLNEGSQAAPFKLAGGDIAGELAKAQRYFYASPGYGGTIHGRIAVKYNGGNLMSESWTFPVPMRIAPAITFNDGSGNIGKVWAACASTTTAGSANVTPGNTTILDTGWRFSSGGITWPNSGCASDALGLVSAGYQANAEL